MGPVGKPSYGPCPLPLESGDLDAQLIRRKGSQRDLEDLLSDHLRLRPRTADESTWHIARGTFAQANEWRIC